MAKQGILRPTFMDDPKRSIATLAKNGQLPSREPEPDDHQSTDEYMNEKRNIGSLARTGLLGGKRNIASLARSYELPSYGKRNLASVVRGSGKRNMAALARDNMMPQYYYDGIKRNVGALARDWSLPTTSYKSNIKRDVSNEQC